MELPKASQGAKQVGPRQTILRADQGWVLVGAPANTLPALGRAAFSKVDARLFRARTYREFPPFLWVACCG